jgi:hypothetical protein
MFPSLQNHRLATITSLAVRVRSDIHGRFIYFCKRNNGRCSCSLFYHTFCDGDGDGDYGDGNDRRKVLLV